MSGLSEADREALDVGIRQWEDFGGPVLDAITPAVEQIVARHVTAALELAAGAIDIGTRMDEDGAPYDDYGLGRQHSARIVRFVAEDAATPKPPEVVSRPQPRGSGE